MYLGAMSAAPRIVCHGLPSELGTEAVLVIASSHATPTPTAAAATPATPRWHAVVHPQHLHQQGLAVLRTGPLTPSVCWGICQLLLHPSAASRLAVHTPAVAAAAAAEEHSVPMARAHHGLPHQSLRPASLLLLQQTESHQSCQGLPQ